MQKEIKTPKLLITTNNFDNFKTLCENTQVDGIIIGIKTVTNKANYKYSLEELPNLINISNHTNKEIYINIDDHIHETELENLTNILSYLHKLKIKNIIFNDYAIAQIDFENNYQFNLIYNSQTLVTNYGQLEFYSKNNINNVFLPNELTRHELVDFGKNKNNVKLFKQISGYQFMMESRWHLISTFAKMNNIKDDLTNRKLMLKERKRDYSSNILENEKGTCIYTGYNLSLISYIDILIDLNIDYFVIDNFMHDDVWTIKTANIYLKAITLIKEGKYNASKQKLLEEEKDINKPVELSPGFFNGKVEDLKYVPLNVKGEANE
ncbi:MAG: U32 family peptidase [Mycoplasma sp.]|nr:U32 family peptidase [Mycoplasma sp.]